MRPALRPGDALVAVRSAKLRRGQIRCFEHPDRPGFWLVKRVGDIQADTFTARSDNDVTGVVDSRRLGPIPIDGSYRLIVNLSGWNRRSPTRRTTRPGPTQSDAES